MKTLLQRECLFWGLWGSRKTKITGILIALALSLFITGTVFAGINDGLVAYYPFDGNANDESGNGNHGVEFGGLTYEKGISKTAARFDGVDDFVEIDPQSDVSSIGDFTISAWTYLEDWKNQINDDTDRQYIFDGHSHSSDVQSGFYRPGFGLIYDGNAGTQEIHDFIFNGTNFVEQNTKYNIKGRWIHHVFMRKGSNDYTYIDGRLISTTYYRNNKSDSPLNMQHTWFIGTFSGNNPYYRNGIFNYSFYGLLDDLRIYDRALSGAEIQELYNERDGAFYTITQGDFSEKVSPLTEAQSAGDFYGGINADTGYEKSNYSLLFLYRDAISGTLNLFQIHDITNDGSGGSAAFSFSGLPERTGWVFKDDANHAPDKYYSNYVTWTWYNCCTDGGVLGDIDGFAEITITPNFRYGITKWVFLSGDVNNPTYIPLPALTEPVTISIAEQCMEPPPGLVSWWPGDGNAEDVIDGNHGTLGDGASFGDGRHGTAFSFDGIDDYVAVADSANLDITKEITIAAWVNPGMQATDPYTNGGIVLNKEHSYELALTAGTGTIRYALRNSNPGWRWIDTGITVPQGQWSHIALTYNGSGIAVYKDGYIVHERSGSGNIVTTNYPLGIGSRYVGDSGNPLTYWASNFNGLIDEVQLYNRALSAEEIAAIYNAAGAGKCKQESCEQALFTYKGDILPSSDGWSIVNYPYYESTGAHAENGILHFTDLYTWGGSAIHYVKKWDVSPGNINIAEFDIKGKSCGGYGPYPGYGCMYFGTSDGSHNMIYTVYPDRIVSAYMDNGYYDLPETVGAVYYFDTTQAFHTYRAVITEGKAKLFIDGRLVMDQPAGRGIYNVKGVEFGAGSSGATGEAFFDEIRAFRIPVGGCNQPPTADAGPDWTIECSGPDGTLVTLDGSGSSDPDGDALTYSWTWDGGSAEGETPTVTLPYGTTTVTLTVSDGEYEDTDEVTITIGDTAPPSTSAILEGEMGNNGWYVSDVTVTLTSTDSCTGVKEIHYTINGTETVVSGDTASFTLSEDGIHEITYWAVDNAGREGVHGTTPVNREVTPPVTTPVVPEPPDDGNGYYRYCVPVELEAVAGSSDVSAIQYRYNDNFEDENGWNTYTEPLPICETTPIYYRSISNAGNKEEPKTIVIKIDQTPPDITATVDPPANANGWHNTDVTVSFTCTDAASGIAECPQPIVVTTEGAGQVITGTAQDKAGNTASTSVTLNIDKTSPEADISVNPGLLWPPNHKMADVAVEGGANDPTSGVASIEFTVQDEYGTVEPSVSGFNTTIPLEAWRDGGDKDGRHYTITAVITDNAGNETTVSTEAVCPHDMSGGK